MILTETELTLIEERVNAARTNPWRSFVENRDFTGGSSFIMVGEEHNRLTDIELIGATEADQDFIANARQDIPKLINEIRRLKK